MSQPLAIYIVNTSTCLLITLVNLWLHHKFIWWHIINNIVKNTQNIENRTIGHLKRCTWPACYIKKSVVWAHIRNIYMFVSKVSHLLTTLKLGTCAKKWPYISLQTNVIIKEHTDTGSMKRLSICSTCMTFYVLLPLMHHKIQNQISDSFIWNQKIHRPSQVH